MDTQILSLLSTHSNSSYLDILPLLSDRLGASVTILRKQAVPFDQNEQRLVAEVLVRKVPDNQQVCINYFRELE